MQGIDSQTQNELTQCMEDFEDTQDPFSQSQSQHAFIAETPIDPLTIPWGRLVPHANHSRTSYELFPRRPLEHVGSATRSRSTPQRIADVVTASTAACSSSSSLNDYCGINFIGLRNIRPFDRFNEYVIGRSRKCDVVIQKTNCRDDESEKSQSLRNIIHSIISNTHCRIFCLLKSTGSSSTSTSPYSTLLPEMEVYVEDSSGNGTFVNNTTLLKRNERRILHTGDTICLLNPKIVRKKVKDPNLQKELLDYYSFVFINVYQTQGGAGHDSTDKQPMQSQVQLQTRGDGSSCCDDYAIVMKTTPMGGTKHTTNNMSAGRRRGLVDVRSTTSKSVQGGVSTPSSQSGLSDCGPGRKVEKSNNSSSSSVGIDTSMGMMPPPQKRQRTQSMDVAAKVIRPLMPRRIEHEFDLRDEIGSGTCGQVRRAIHRKTGKMVAVKIISMGGTGGIHRTLSKVSKEGILDPNIQAEVSILQSLDHPYIVKLLDVFVHPGKAVYLVMELLQGGDLFDRIVRKGKYSELESRRIMRRMLAALHYLHQQRDIVHRDLKPENILCVSKSDDITVKLTDFGLAKSITEDGLKTFCGTPQYFAPEVLSRRTSVEGTGRYGKEADIWSLGVILYILISGAPPFDATIDDVTVPTRLSFSEPIWKATSHSAIDLIRKMLTKDPEKRIDIVEACAHEWIMTPDGDTHVHPLDDPVVLETSGIHLHKPPDTTALNVPATKLSFDAPQSEVCHESNTSGSDARNINPGHNMDNSWQSFHYDDGLKNTKPIAVSSGGKNETISPNQSAKFPTPQRDPINQTKGTPGKKRNSLFSLVKQLSNESADKVTTNVSCTKDAEIGEDSHHPSKDAGSTKNIQAEATVDNKEIASAENHIGHDDTIHESWKNNEKQINLSDVLKDSVSPSKIDA
jgi:serine/threonine protein kinase